MVGLSPLFLGAALSGVVSLAFAVLVSLRWQKPGADWFVVSIVGGACWAFAAALGFVVTDESLLWALEVATWVGHGVAPVAAFVFVLRYTGRTESLSASKHVLLWTVPALTVGVVLTNDLHHLMWDDMRTVETLVGTVGTYEKGLWVFVHKAYTYLVLGGTAVALGHLILARDSLYTVQGFALGAIMTVLAAASSVWTFELGPYPEIDPTPFLFGPIYAVAAVVLFRSSLLDSAPAARRIGKRRVIDDFDDGVLLVDDTDRIVDANDAASVTLEADRSELVGKPIVEVIPEAGDGVVPGRFTASLETTSSYRTYEVTISKLTDDRGSPLGHSLVFHDVTDETRRRQRLTVLNRVLRHNLRNDLNVIQTYAAELEADLEAPRDELARVIVEQSRELASLGEKARRIERTLDVPDEQPTAVDLEALARSIVESYRHRASFTIDVEADLDLVTYPSLLEIVLEDAVENAVEHGGPSVRIRARSVGRTVDLCVIDDGAGIPPAESAPLEAGTETALEHGSGLGLWLISWGSSQLGGTAAFERPAGGGTRVRIRLPAHLDGRPRRDGVTDVSDEGSGDEGDGDEGDGGVFDDGDEGDDRAPRETITTDERVE